MTNSGYRQLEYQLQFLTPAFMGNAEQSAQWRTPPFKALLRQWWRVVYAANHGFKVDIERMRHAEGTLFGHAWLDSDTNEQGKKTAARKSRIRMRLGMPDGVDQHAWAAGTQRGVEPLSTGLDTSYAWFGLIKRGKGLPDRSALKPVGNEGLRVLRLAVPEADAAALEETLVLINSFGLLGSRSRGGWGALQVDDMPAISATDALKYSCPLSSCLQTGWPMSLARDELGLMIWRSTQAFASWDNAMRFVAGQRKNVRTGLDKNARAVLGFAQGSDRMASPLRWKLIPDGQGQLRVQVFAMPYMLPSKVRVDGHKTWQRVASILDNVAFTRLAE